MHIDATLEGTVKRYKAELRGATSQLHESVSMRQLLFFVGHTPCQASGSPAHSYSLGNVNSSDQFYGVWYLRITAR